MIVAMVGQLQHLAEVDIFGMKYDQTERAKCASLVHVITGVNTEGFILWSVFSHGTARSSFYLGK